MFSTVVVHIVTRSAWDQTRWPGVKDSNEAPHIVEVICNWWTLCEGNQFSSEKWPQKSTYTQKMALHPCTHKYTDSTKWTHWDLKIRYEIERKLLDTFIMSYCGSWQLQLIATDNSDVNPPEKLFPDRGTLPSRYCRAPDHKNCCFHL